MKKQKSVPVLTHYPCTVSCLMKQAVVVLYVFPLRLISFETREWRDTNTTDSVCSCFHRLGQKNLWITLRFTGKKWVDGICLPSKTLNKIGLCVYYFCVRVFVIDTVSLQFYNSSSCFTLKLKHESKTIGQLFLTCLHATIWVFVVCGVFFTTNDNNVCINYIWDLISELSLTFLILFLSTGLFLHRSFILLISMMINLYSLEELTMMTTMTTVWPKMYRLSSISKSLNTTINTVQTEAKPVSKSIHLGQGAPHLACCFSLNHTVFRNIIIL